MVKYIENYPRPQFIRNEWENLNGEWNFAFDDKNIGEKDNYFTNFPIKNKINVPFTYETELSGINDQTIHNIVWYNRKISITDSQILDRKVILHFEGCDYLTKIWINGKYVGKNEGGYTRFSFEINKYLVLGVNEITVKVEDSLSKSQPRGKQRYKKESWECWYIQTTGIWKTVWMEFVANEYISYVKNTPDYDNNKIQLVIETSIPEMDYTTNDFSFEFLISFNSNLIQNKRIKLTELARNLRLI